MVKRLDLVGKVFSRLTVVRFSHVNVYSYWVCECQCGNTVTVAGYSLTSKNTTSCGCYNKEKIVERNQKLAKYQGLTQDKIYWAWLGMIKRCYKDYGTNKKYYQDKGIEVCEEWRNDFLTFREWSLSNGYDENLSLDRIDNNGNYKPSNCRWTTYEEQSNNTSRTRLIEYKGEIKSISQWARVFDIDRKTITYRLSKGWDIDSVFTKPENIRKKG